MSEQEAQALHDFPESDDPEINEDRALLRVGFLRGAEWQSSRKPEAAPSDTDRGALRKAVSLAVYGDERVTLGTERVVENLVTAGFSRSQPVQVDPREVAHIECDCVPDIGPSHCHLCSECVGYPVLWSEAHPQPVQVEVTDDMVEKAAREYHERGNGEGSFDRVSDHVRTSLLFRIRAALSAALGGGGE